MSEREYEHRIQLRACSLSRSLPYLIRQRQISAHVRRRKLAEIRLRPTRRLQIIARVLSLAAKDQRNVWCEFSGFEQVVGVV